MKRTALVIVALLFAVAAGAAKLQYVKGSTSVEATVFIQDSSSTTGAGLTGLVWNTAGLGCHYYLNSAAADVDITLATATLGTWATGGFIVVDATNQPGMYSLHLPDAALASSRSVTVFCDGATNMAPLILEIQLTDVDMNDGVRAGLTSLPNAAADAAGGLAISDAGGLDLDALNTNVNDIETDTALYDTDAERRVAQDAALVAIGLDHLVGAAVVGADVTDNSIVAFMVGDDATADWDTFNNTTDSLEALRVEGDASWGAAGTGLSTTTGTAQTASHTTTALILAASAVTHTDNFKWQNITITSGDCANQTRTIVSSVAASDTVNVAPAFDESGTCAIDADFDAATYEIAATSPTLVPAAASDAAGGLPISDTGGLDLDALNVNINDIETDTSTTLDDLVDDLESRLTAVRAGYLDELGPTNIPQDLDAVLVDTSTTLDDFIDTEVAALQTDLDNATDGLGALKALIDTAQTDLDLYDTDAERRVAQDAALVAVRLDELVSADSDIDGAAPPTDGSVFQELMSKTAVGFTFAQSTDSHEGIADGERGTDSAALASVATEARLAELDAANLPTDVDAILVDTGTTLDAVVDAIKLETDKLTLGDAGAGVAGSIIEEIEDIITQGDAAWVTGGASPNPTGTCDSGSTTTCVDTERTEADDDYFNDSWIRFTSGTLDGQTRLISDFTASSDTITLAKATTTAVTTHTYEIVPAAEITGASAPTAADVATAVWDRDIVAAHNTADTAGELIDGDATGGQNVVSLAASTVTAAAIATDAIGAAEIAADAIGASEMATAAIGADEISADAIGASEIAGNAIGSAELAPDAINAAVIAADAIGASEIAAAAITSSEAPNLDQAVSDNATPTEVATELATIRLDELMAADSDIDGAAPPTDGSVIQELMTSTAIGFTWAQSTDSLEAIADAERGTDSALLAASAPTNFGDLDIEVTTGRVDVYQVEGLDATTNIENSVWNADLVAAHNTSNTAGELLDGDSTDGVNVVLMAGAVEAGIADATWNETATGHTTAGFAGEQLWTDLDAVLVDTSTTLDGKIDAVDDYVDAEVAAILADTGTDGVVAGAANAAFVADFFEVDSGTSYAASVAGSVVKETADNASSTTSVPDLMVSTTIATLASQTSFTLTSGSADDDAYPAGSVAIVTDASTSTQKAVGYLSDYVGSSKTVTLAADPGIFTMAATDNIAIVAATSDPLNNVVPGNYASGTIGHTMGTVLPGNQVTIVDPVAANLEITIYQGDDYSTAGGNALDWTLAAGAAADLSGATIEFKVTPAATAALTIVGSVVTSGAGAQVVRAELTDTESASLSVGSHRYHVRTTLADAVTTVTLVRGTAKVNTAP